jgi:hypothetical protein
MSYTDTPQKIKHNMKAAHKWTKECCGASEASHKKKSMASKMKVKSKDDVKDYDLMHDNKRLQKKYPHLNKGMWDFMDKVEGRKDSSFKNMSKESKRQGY